MRRRLLALLAVGLLAVTAGCAGPGLGLFGGGISDEDLAKEPSEPYDWNTTRDVTITVLGGTHQAVYDLSNTTKLEMYKHSIGNDEPLSLWALRYRYPNGTIINGTAPPIAVTQEGSNTVVTVPDGDGMLAYSAGAGTKEFGTPSYVEGSYEVILPPDRRTNSFLLAEVQPGGYETSVDDRSRVHFLWDEVTGTVYIRYYLIRDKLIFQGLVVVLVLVAGGGVLYYYRKIRQLEEQREALGLDVDTDPDDEFGRDPPRGMG
jgi:hypothetical protein